jgi:hypothetical protein
MQACSVGEWKWWMAVRETPTSLLPTLCAWVLTGPKAQRRPPALPPFPLPGNYRLVCLQVTSPLSHPPPHTKATTLFIEVDFPLGMADLTSTAVSLATAPSFRGNLSSQLAGGGFRGIAFSVPSVGVWWWWWWRRGGESEVEVVGAARDSGLRGSSPVITESFTPVCPRVLPIFRAAVIAGSHRGPRAPRSWH